MPWPRPGGERAPTCSNFSPRLSIWSLIRSTPSGGIRRLRLRFGFWLIALRGRRREAHLRTLRLDRPGPTLVFQKWIVLALLADCGLGAMAGDDDRVIRQREELFVQGIDDLLEGAAGQIGSADAAFGVAGRENYIRGQRACLHRVRLPDTLIDFHFARRRHSHPGGLHIE